MRVFGAPNLRHSRDRDRDQSAPTREKPARPSQDRSQAERHLVSGIWFLDVLSQTDLRILQRRCRPGCFAGRRSSLPILAGGATTPNNRIIVTWRPRLINAHPHPLVERHRRPRVSILRQSRPRHWGLQEQRAGVGHGNVMMPLSCQVSPPFLPLRRGCADAFQFLESNTKLRLIARIVIFWHPHGTFLTRAFGFYGVYL